MRSATYKELFKVGRLFILIVILSSLWEASNDSLDLNDFYDGKIMQWDIQENH